MNYIDSAILNLTEWACRKFQVLTGRSNVWLAGQLTNLSIIAYFVWAGMLFWTSDVWPRTLVALFCGGLLYVLSQTLFKIPIEAYETEAYRRVARGLRNPRRVRDAGLRISFLTLSLVLCCLMVLFYNNTQLRAHVTIRADVLFLSYSLIVLTVILLYVLACDPLPPCAGRVREWLRGSAPSRAAATEPSPPTSTSVAVPPADLLFEGVGADGRPGQAGRDDHLARFQRGPAPLERPASMNRRLMGGRR